MPNYFYELSPLNISSDVITNKKQAAWNEVRYTITRLQEMFRYDGLPETIEKDYMEYYMLTAGQCFITKVRGNLYALTGNAGGEPDAYRRPTRYIIANPYLKFNADLSINDDGVLMRNDWWWMGLLPLISKYAVLSAENFLTIRVADIILRAMSLLSAPDDKTKKAGELFLDNLEKGKLGVIGETAFFDGIRLQSPPSNNGSYLTQFIELHQYLKGALWQELGVDALSNMKRESLSEGETHLNEGTLLPLADHMLRIRKADVEKLNSMYNLYVTVEFSSAWEKLREQMDLANELAKSGFSPNPANQLGQNGENPENPENPENLENSENSENATNELGGNTENAKKSENEEISGEQGSELQISPETEDTRRDAENAEVYSSSEDSGVQTIVEVEVNINSDPEETEKEEEDDRTVG